MQKTGMAFCENCRTDNSYIAAEINLVGTLNGKQHHYNGICAHCTKCGKEVFVPEIQNENLKRLYTTYYNFKEREGI